MEKHTNIRRAAALYTPMALYFGFIILFLVTRLLLFSLVTGSSHLNPQSFPRSYNLVPFVTISRYLNASRQRLAYLDVVGNILLFVPMGAYIHTLCRKKRLWLSALLSLLSTLLIEAAQFALATGAFDVDDILMNFIGAAAGVLICHLVYRLCKGDEDASRLNLSALSVAVIPPLVATVLQYALWVPAGTFVPVSLLAFAAAYTALYFLFFCRESKSIRLVYGVSCMALCLLFYAAVMPMVS